MATAFRIHDADEPLANLLDPYRPDGWVASDESRETQPEGVSCCETIEDLMRYVRAYGMSEQPGSLLVELTGDFCGRDRDQWARRMRVRSARIIGRGDRLIAAAYRQAQRRR